ncbi:hypothetical protein AZKH_4341 [Azoarcus sp. KH32C]|nr:hypothetical protein AZKH_4341 [Azoarcus sp. KH32C]
MQAALDRMAGFGRAEGFGETIRARYFGNEDADGVRQGHVRNSVSDSSLRHGARIPNGAPQTGSMMIVK